ncbi:MAG: hypothetical protein P8N21_00550, partial [Opitutales bacterium]|nr:hypothetical protein [Opitutales bacterium]
MKFQNTFIIAQTISCFLSFALHASVGGVSGSNVFTIADGNYSEPTYKIVSAATLGDSVFSGSVASSSNSDQNITFATGTDENNATTYPFFAAGAFKPDVQLPEGNFTVSINGDGNITAVSTPTYRSNFDTSGVGFDSAPEIIVSPSDGGGDTASITAAIDSNGKISGFNVVSGGTGYTTAAELTVIGGPHFARIASEDSTYYGRCFLITNNSRTNLTLDMSNLAQGESSNVSTYFPAGTLVEVVRAATLGEIFGSYWPVGNWTSATGWRGTTGNTVDWVYVYDPSLGGYTKYLHIAGGGLYGWYSRDKGYGVKCNNTVIYPDEAFIVARRSSGTVTLESEISFDDSPTQIYLPESGKTFIANNPFGMDLLLTEIIPSTEIHDSTTSKFRAGASDSDTDMDTITILASGTWKKYWYKSGVNSGITTTMEAGGKAGSGGSSAMTTSDLFIGSGSISAIQSSSNAAGTSVVTNYNDGNYTKLTLTGTAPGTGFTITLSDIQGYMLSDDGANELNATSLETVDTNGTGSIVYSNISGNFEIVGSGSGFVVIEKQRDVNFKSNEGSPAWSIGNVGAGYTNSSSTATWYAVGGGGTGANGTITTNGSGQYSSFNLTAGGSGYSSAPQIIISGGGWRYSDNSSQDNLTVGSSDGLIIYRGATGGVKTFIEAN